MYPLPKMDHILQRVVGASRMSLLDGYFGYNQVSVHEDDQEKTTFTTPWGTFHYAKMSFDLKNAGARFQRAMDLAFENEKDAFLVVYLDDLIVFSKSDEEHMYHLKIVFQKCRKYGLSLNPKKSLFAMEEVKLLGNIISKDGILIDPAHVQAIQQIDLSRSKKEIQSFNGKMNFLCRFVPNLAEHLREMTNMLKKDSQVKWMEEAVKSFNLVKLDLSSAPVLVSRNYTKDFILFSFASEHTMAALLLWKRDDHERPVAFFSRAIRDEALKYNIFEKQALALVKALKDFQVYILHSHILTCVPNAVVKDVLVQTDLEGRRGKWIAALLEYDIIYVLKNLSPPPSMIRNKVRTLKLKAAKFCILNFALYWKDLGGILLNCLVEKEAKKVMEDCHQGDCGGHLFWKSTANKILRAGWILIATDYFTKRIEAIPTRQATDAVIISFLENNILSHFSCPNKLIADNAIAFKSKRMVEFCHKYHIILGHSTAYHPQGNGLAESSNKSLVNIIKKLLEINKKSWHKRKAKVDKFQVDDVVLKWDARNEEKGKHGKLENLWKGPFKIAAYQGQNAFLLKEMNEEDCPGGPVNGRLLKRYHF
eukprot:PITA_12194